MHVDAMDRFRFEPTVLRATRRHRVAVLLVVGLSTVIGLVLPLLERPAYVATVGITVPLPAEATEQTAGPFLDDQVLLLRSSAVADRAAVITADAIGPGAPGLGAFLGETPSLEVTPPESSSSGSYGASTVLVGFTWHDARGAQVAVNAVVQAFNEVRVDTIRSRGDATAAALQRAADEAPNAQQRDTLLSQRSQVLANQQIDLATAPTVAGGVLPETPTNRDWAVGAAVGLLLGLLIGPTLAYTWASLRGGFDDASEPAGYYGVPLLGGIDARSDRRRGWGLPWRRRRGGSWEGTSRTAAEDMRFAATALERTRTTVDPSRVLVAVAPRGSRATGTVVAGVALAMAEGGHRVLVVGADPTDTTVTDVLDPGGLGPGLAEVVAGTATPEEAARPVRGNAHVAVMGAGAQSAGRKAGEPYRRAVAGALGELAADYDVVLVAAPGLLDTAVSGELVEAADATVLVLGRREPARDHLAVAQRLELSGATVLGYVFLPVAPPRIAVDSTPQSADGPAEHEVVDGGVEEIPVTPLGPVPAINGQQTPVSAMNGSRPTPFPRDRD